MAIGEQRGATGTKVRREDREPPYEGEPGRTRLRSIHVPLPNGFVRTVQVYDVVDVAADPQLREPALSGALHRFETGEELALPFVYHDPKTRKLALVVPEVLRHRELHLRARLLTELAEDTSAPVPSYVREAKVVVGTEKLRAYLEEADSAAGELAQRESELAQRESELTQRETQLEKQGAKEAQRQRTLAQQARDLEVQADALTQRESRLQSRAEEVTFREDELRASFEELEAAQADLAMREQELESRLEMLRQREEEVSRRAESGSVAVDDDDVVELDDDEVDAMDEVEELEPLATNVAPVAEDLADAVEMGRASCRERVCQYV